MQTNSGAFTTHENPPSSCVTPPLPQKGMENDQTLPNTTTGDDVSVEPADTSAIKTVNPSGKQASAGTDIDDTEDVLQKLQKMTLCIGK